MVWGGCFIRCNSSSDDTTTTTTTTTPTETTTPAALTTNAITLTQTYFSVWYFCNDVITGTNVTYTANHIIADTSTTQLDSLQLIHKLT